MKLRYAAIFTTIAFTAAAAYTALLLLPALQINRAQPVLLRGEWMAGNQATWTLGGWLWLLAIFSWMVLLVTLIWAYSPAHRVPTMLQSGLIVIGALLSIIGVVSWMGLLPVALGDVDALTIDALAQRGDLMRLVDGLALGLLGAGLFMGGAVTAWLCIDLAQLKLLPWHWVLPGAAAGALAVPAPFVLPSPWLPALACFALLTWSLLLATRSEMPSAFPEWQ